MVKQIRSRGKARQFRRLMTAKKWTACGWKVTQSWSLHPPAKSAPYAVGKAAQEALILALAQESKDAGVTANILQVRTINVKPERDCQPLPKNASWTTLDEILSVTLPNFLILLGEEF